jgi:hypothetical protein
MGLGDEGETVFDASLTSAEMVLTVIAAWLIIRTSLTEIQFSIGRGYGS